MPRRALALLPLVAALAGADPWTRSADGSLLNVTLPGEVRLGFALAGDRLLGLNTAEVGGVALKSPATANRPWIAQEWPELHPQGPVVGHALRLRTVEKAGDGVVLRLDLLGSRGDTARRALFVHQPDRDRALLEPSAAMRAAQPARDAAEAAYAAFLAARPDMSKAAADNAKTEAEIAKAAADGLSQWPRELRKRIDQRLEKVHREARKAFAAEPGNTAHVQAIQAWESAVNARAAELAKIQRDYYEFAFLRLPSEAIALPVLTALQTAEPAPVAMGTLDWTLAPSTRSVGGWTWRGWASSYRAELAEGMQANAIRTLGTWELGGDPVGTTLISVRYRGIGGFTRTLAARPDGGVRDTFTTTEIIPGAVDGAPVISPAIPSGASIEERGYGLRHRAGAWIARLGRGAGHPLMDWQHRGNACFVVAPERQGNLRALTEVFPEDRAISHTDEETFPLGRSLGTVPMHHLVMTATRQLTENEARTRWLEMDQDVRDRVSAELGFVQPEAVPAIGVNIDNVWANEVGRLAKLAPQWTAAGARAIFVHHPGWVNGRAISRGAKGNTDHDGAATRFVGGGDCAIYAWRPLAEAVEPWKALTRALAADKATYHVWLTGMSVIDAGMHREVGSDLRHWAINRPGGTDASGYPYILANHNILDTRLREVLLGQLERSRQEVGFQGFWADSFQNLFMTTLDWANGTGAPMQRAWWEQIAAWSRQGLAWTSESVAVPGLSCSMEAQADPEGVWFGYHHVFQWYRVGFPNPGTDKADRLVFRVMAHKGAIGAQGGNNNDPLKAIPSFSRLAHEYTAAQPDMRRGWILEGEGGTLWLPYAGDRTGVWFSFSDQPVPAGVTATGILDKAPASAAKAHHTYRVAAADLIAAFGLLKAPGADERRGRTWTPIQPTWPEWATKP